MKKRLPPGQTLTDKWPVLHYGPVPRRQLKDWNFRVWGLVDKPVVWTWDEFQALPKMTINRDISCVTRWTRFDLNFEGVPFKEVLRQVQVQPAAQFVMVHAENGFTTNLPLDDLLQDDVLFAHKAEGQELELEHGWPLRLVVPHLYFWKSAKWVRGLEFMAQNAPGFWEEAGYHMRGDPWKEERYGW
ncbi:MAG TPA: molybdopterin-dependent oxidoreductase [Chloroflexia bacterium]|nr:molybdopterin-dependent oxidoreductase [Chloroflexia bacterium]